MSEIFFCTRARLAGKLISKGVQAEVIQNPWVPTQSAWLIPLDDQVYEIASAFYTEIGAKLPKALKTYARRRSEDE